MIKIHCAIFRPSHAPWRRWSPVAPRGAVPTRRPGLPPPGGSPRRPSVTKRRTPHAAFHPAATHRTPCAPIGSFSSLSIASGPCRAPLPSPRASLWPARLEEENGSGPSITTNDLVKKKTDALAATGTHRTQCAPRVWAAAAVVMKPVPVQLSHRMGRVHGPTTGSAWCRQCALRK